MSNHVINEVRFTSVTPPQVERILGLARNQSKEIDFSILLPVPLNCWQGSVGSEHAKFPDNALAWCSKNWSTKWNAYGAHYAEYDGADLVLRFKTAWNAPYGWLCALFNAGKLGFSYAYLSEGESAAHVGKFSLTPDSGVSDMEWKEIVANQEERDHLGMLLWGEEAWAEIEQEGRTESA